MYFTDSSINFTDEELLKIFQEEKDKEYTLVSTSIMQYHGCLINNYEQAKLFAMKDIEATSLANELSQQLRINAACHNGESSLTLDFELFFEGAYKDLPNFYKNEFKDIENYGKNVIAVRREIIGYRSEPSYVYRYETCQRPIYKYYLFDFKIFLGILRENNVSYSVKFPNDGKTKNEDFSTFILSYTRENTRKKD